VSYTTVSTAWFGVASRQIAAHLFITLEGCHPFSIRNDEKQKRGAKAESAVVDSDEALAVLSTEEEDTKVRVSIVDSATGIIRRSCPGGICHRNFSSSLPGGSSLPWGSVDLSTMGICRLL
jgi:hypothetical protein